MIRRFCYTGRKALGRERVEARITQRTHPPTFDIRLDLSSADLPATARVFVEAYHKASYMRFPWGTVGMLEPAEDRRLTGLESPEGVLFRVKVVATDESRGRLLAEADQVSPILEGEGEQGRKSLLPVRLAALGEQVWKLNLDDGRPVLELNTRLQGQSIKEFARHDRTFRALVMPAVLRQVLLHYHDSTQGDMLDNDEDPWCARWVKFAEALHPPPPRDDLEPEEARRWIEDVVAAFARRNSLATELQQHLLAQESDA